MARVRPRATGDGASDGLGLPGAQAVVGQCRGHGIGSSKGTNLDLRWVTNSVSGVRLRVWLNTWSSSRSRPNTGVIGVVGMDLEAV